MSKGFLYPGAYNRMPDGVPYTVDDGTAAPIECGKCGRRVPVNGAQLAQHVMAHAEEEVLYGGGMWAEERGPQPEAHKSIYDYQGQLEAKRKRRRK